MNNLTNAQPRGRVEEARAESIRGGPVFSPFIDILETDGELLLLADLPGVRAEDVELHFEQGELTLHARVQPRMQAKESLMREYEEGDFHRVFSVHESIDTSKIEAQCKNGVLTVKLPKMEAARPRQIQVRTA